jgi:type IV pilus assembly protein PilA
MKQRGFTLIELLVVVAIIGILAAVGVVAYSGYTSSAKKIAIKAQQKNIINYIMSETKKCLFQDTSMDGNLICSNLNTSNNTDVHVIINAAEKALKNKLKNPVNPSLPAVCSSENGTCQPYNYQSTGSGGVVNLRSHGPTTMEVGTCFSEPCKGKDVGYIESGYIVITN